MLVDIWTMALAKSFESYFSARGLEPRAGYDLRTAALHVGSLAREIVQRTSPSDTPPDALLPAILCALIEPDEEYPVRALRVCRSLGPELLRVARARRPKNAGMFAEGFALAPDTGALPVTDTVEVKFLLQEPPSPEDPSVSGRGLAVLSPPGRVSTACLTWRRGPNGLEIRLDRRRPECAELEPHRVGKGRARALLAKAGHHPHRLIERFEAMLTAGRILHENFRRLRCLAPVQKIAPGTSMDAAIDAVEAGKTFGDVEAAVEARGMLH